MNVKDQLQAFGLKWWSAFKGFAPGQKAVTIVAALALLIGGYVFLTWKSSATYAPLFTNLAPADASAIVDKLNAQGVPYQLSAAGTEVLVPQSQVYSTRLTMSAAGLPGSSQTGYSLLDKEGVTTSQFKQQVDYQRAIEGELGKTIQAINGVQAATVHLAIPQQNVFNDGTQKPTAAVMVATSQATTLTASQVQSIVYLVSSSVPGMTTGGVTVTDSAGNVLAAPGSNLSATAGASSQAQLTQQYNNQIQTNLQNMIDQAIGPGHAAVTVNSNLDFSKTSTTQQNYVYDKNAPPLSVTKSTESYSGAGGTSGVLGSTGTTAATGGNGASKYTKTSGTQDNALGTKTTTTENAPGALKNLSVAVVLDKSVKGVSVAAITNLVKSGVGFSAARGDSISVQALPFNNSSAASANVATLAAQKAAAAKTAHDNLMSVIKQGALAALVLLVLFGTWLSGRRRRKAAARATKVTEINDDLFGLDEQEPEIEEDSAEVVDIREAAAKRRSLAAVADDRPEDVARVLSGWLNTKGS